MGSQLQGVMETAQRFGIDVQKLRKDAVPYVKNNPLWPIRPEGIARLA